MTLWDMQTPLSTACTTGTEKAGTVFGLMHALLLTGGLQLCCQDAPSFSLDEPSHQSRGHAQHWSQDVQAVLLQDWDMWKAQASVPSSWCWSYWVVTSATQTGLKLVPGLRWGKKNKHKLKMGKVLLLLIFRKRFGLYFWQEQGHGSEYERHILVTGSKAAVSKLHFHAKINEIFDCDFNRVCKCWKQYNFKVFILSL